MSGTYNPTTGRFMDIDKYVIGHWDTNRIYTIENFTGYVIFLFENSILGLHTYGLAHGANRSSVSWCRWIEANGVNQKHQREYNSILF